MYLINNIMVNASLFAAYLEGRTTKNENREVMKAVASSKELFSFLSVAAAVKSCETLIDETGKFIGLERVQTIRKGGMTKFK